MALISLTISGKPIASAAALALPAPKKGVTKEMPVTSIPWRISVIAARVLSSPPDISPSAFVIFSLH